MCVRKRKTTVDAKLGSWRFLAALFLMHRHQLLRPRHWLIFKGPSPVLVDLLSLDSAAHRNGEEGKLEWDFSRILAECWHRFLLSQCSHQQNTALRIGEEFALILFFYCFVWNHRWQTITRITILMMVCANWRKTVFGFSFNNMDFSLFIVQVWNHIPVFKMMCEAKTLRHGLTPALCIWSDQ